MSGFTFAETMSGSYFLDEAPQRDLAMSFTVKVEVHSLSRFVRDRMATIEGEVVLEGRADHRALRGTLEMDLPLGRKLRYEFDFVDDAGRKCRFAGQKDVEFTRLMHTMTTLPGELFADGKRFATATVRFDARSDLGAFLGSFRPLGLPGFRR